MESGLRLNAGRCLYLYAIVRAGRSDWAAGALAGADGIEGEPDVGLLRCEGLAAAASPAPLSVYNDESLKARAADPEWLALRAARHEQVVRRLMRISPVIPLKFGTLGATVEGVRDMLRARHEPLARLLDFVDGREEWGAKVYVNESRAARAAGQCDAGSAALERRLLSAPPGEAYFLRKQKEKLLAGRKEHLAVELGEAVYHVLAGPAVEARKSGWAAAGSATEELPILNMAVLVEQGQVHALAQAAGECEARYQDCGLRVELSGPWAPYSFCDGLGAEG